jgi:hypothetical protein
MLFGHRAVADIARGDCWARWNSFLKLLAASGLTGSDANEWPVTRRETFRRIGGELLQSEYRTLLGACCAPSQWSLLACFHPVSLAMDLGAGTATADNRA